jgi:hypothetical protein
VPKLLPVPQKEIWVNTREDGYDRWDEADWARVALVNEGRDVRIACRGGKYYVEMRK